MSDRADCLAFPMEGEGKLCQDIVMPGDFWDHEWLFHAGFVLNLVIID